MKSFGDMQAFPVEDAGLSQALHKALGSAGKPQREEMLEMAQAWKGWEAYLTYYWWRTLM
jgi:DNA-3-methyladenine glycosylase II